MFSRVVSNFRKKRKRSLQNKSISSSTASSSEILNHHSCKKGIANVDFETSSNEIDFKNSNLLSNSTQDDNKSG